MAADLETKLAKLRDLHAAGFINDAEHAEQKRAVLNASLGIQDPAPPATGPRTLGGATRWGGPAEQPSGVSLPPPEATLPEDLPERLGSYQILGVAGAGGMGTVVRARHVEPGWAAQQGGDVAIKLIQPDIASAPEFRDRFLAEAALGRRVQHPGLVPTWDVVAEGPWLGTVMGFVSGKTLESRVRSGGMTPAEVATLLTPVADTVDFLHHQGIVHRDIKPANIMIRDDGHLVVLDLGIAKDRMNAASDQTRAQTTMGTSAWMAPEQADASEVDGAADRYAFGLVAYALLSGRLPWGEQDSELFVQTQKVTGRLMPLADARPDLPSTITGAVMKMMAVEPAERYASCREFVAALGSSQPSTDPNVVQLNVKPQKESTAPAEPPVENQSEKQQPPRKQGWLSWIFSGGLLAVIVAIIAVIGISDSEDSKKERSRRARRR